MHTYMLIFSNPLVIVIMFCQNHDAKDKLISSDIRFCRWLKYTTSISRKTWPTILQDGVASICWWSGLWDSLRKQLRLTFMCCCCTYLYSRKIKRFSCSDWVHRQTGKGMWLCLSSCMFNYNNSCFLSFLISTTFRLWIFFFPF